VGGCARTALASRADIVLQNATGDENAGEQRIIGKVAAEWVTASTLQPWDRNPRKNDAAAADVARSIVRFGFGNPILARPDGEVIAGHTRLKAVALLPGLWRKATAKGRESWSADARALAVADEPLVPVRYLDLSDVEAHALALADNKLGELAEWDDADVKALLEEMVADNVSLEGMGWTDEALAALLAEPEEGEDTSDPGTGPEPMTGIYAVLVTCADERHQRELLERFTAEELECRAWNL